MKKEKIRFLAQGALIAALYAALTLLANALGLAIGTVEFRFSEALCVLPVFTPAAVPGLFFGCLLANLLCGASIFDIVLGSIASLLGAMGTYVFRKKPFLPYFSPVFFNTLLIPPVLYFAYGFQEIGFFPLVASFFLGEAIQVFFLGYLLKRALTPFQKYFT